MRISTSLPKMSLDQFTEVLKNLSNKKDKYYYQINKQLLDSINSMPDKILEFCNVGLEFYGKNGKSSLYATTMNTIIRVFIKQKQPNEIMESYIEGIKFVSDNKLYTEGINIIHTMEQAFSEDLFTREEYIQFLKYSIGFYNNFGKYNKSIDLMCKVAYEFSTVSAFQSAYRILNDAEQLAKKNSLQKSLVKIIIVSANICVEERDFNYAEFYYQEAIKLALNYKLKTENDVIINLATVKMKKRDYIGALEVYYELLKNKKLDEKIKIYIKTNLSVCERELGNLNKSIEIIEEVIKSIDKHAFNTDTLIETCMIASRTYLLAEDYEEGTHYLNKAISFIMIELENENRLHYRRGIKEKYIERILLLLLKIPRTIKNNKIIRVLLFTKTNMFSDWLSVLDWYQEVIEDKNIDKSIRDQLTNYLNKIINFGAPVLFGFYEKYDDPFEEYGDRWYLLSEWNKFNMITETIKKKYNKEGIYKNCSLDSLETIFIERLRNKTCYIFMYIISSEIVFFNLTDNILKIVNFEIQPYIEYYKTLLNYQRKFESFINFTKSLDNIVKKTSEGLNEVFNDIVSTESDEIVIIQDKAIDFIPIMSAMIFNDSLRNYIKKSNVKIKFSPIIYKQKNNESSYSKFVGITDPAENLPMLNEELKLAKSTMEIIKNNIFDLSKEKINYKNINLKEADIIHIVSHGTCISNFTDPIFASISGVEGSNSMHLEMLQRYCWKYNYNLVVNNFCDSANITYKNYFKSFKTNEIISYSTILLLNRKSQIISVSWPIKDIVSYVFMAIYYYNLSKSTSIEEAYINSMIKMYYLTKDELFEIISKIKEPKLREEKQKMISYINSQYPFRNPYMYGGFILTSLI